MHHLLPKRSVTSPVPLDEKIKIEILKVAWYSIAEVKKC